MRLKTKRNAALMLSFLSALGWNLPAPSPVTAATIGNTGLVNFSAIVVSSYCDIITNVNGALAVTKIENKSHPIFPCPALLLVHLVPPHFQSQAI
jgi:hypothetical protein